MLCQIKYASPKSNVFLRCKKSHPFFLWHNRWKVMLIWRISADKVARVCTTNITKTNYLKEDHHFISCVYNCDDLPSNNSSLHSSHIWFSYIHNFIIILLRVYNEPIQRPAPNWLVSLIGWALHRYRRGQGFESRTSRVFFFRLSFRNA